MTHSADWPTWLSSAQFNAIQALAATNAFAWSVRHQVDDVRTAVYGRCVRGLEEEINVILRSSAYDGKRQNLPRSLVGVYLLGRGFWQGGREPGMVVPITSATGTADEVLDVAKAWAKGRRS